MRNLACPCHCHQGPRLIFVISSINTDVERLFFPVAVYACCDAAGDVEVVRSRPTSRVQLYPKLVRFQSYSSPRREDAEGSLQPPILCTRLYRAR